MNTLFNKDGAASNMIRCTKGGPNGEVQLKMTLPLPHQLMKGFEDFVPTKQEIQTAMEHIRANGDKFAKKCNFDYSGQHFDEQVIDDDFAGRIRPEFYKSLFESQTEATSTVGDEMGLQSVMLGSEKREHESAFSPNLTRFPRSGRTMIESNSGALGIPRPNSLPSQIEMSGTSSYMSSQESYGLPSFDMRKKPPFTAGPDVQRTLYAKKAAHGDFKQSNIRDSIENRNFDQPSLHSSRFTGSARKPQIPNYDYEETTENPSFDEGDFSHVKSQGQQKRPQREKNALSKFTIPNKNDQQNWIPAKREQLDLVDPEYPRPDRRERNPAVKSKTEETAAPKPSSNAAGIPDSVKYSNESYHVELETACSDLTVDEEAFAQVEQLIVRPVSLSDQSTAEDPKLKLPSRTPMNAPPPKIPSPKKSFRESRDNDRPLSSSSDELMGPADESMGTAKKQFDYSERGDELMSPTGPRRFSESGVTATHRKPHLAKMAPASSSEDIPTDELLGPGPKQLKSSPTNYMSRDEETSPLEKGGYKTKLARNESRPSVLSNEEMPMDEFMTPAKTFNPPLVDKDLSHRDQLALTPAPKDPIWEDGGNVSVAIGSISKTVASRSSRTGKEADDVQFQISIGRSASVDTPMDEPGQLNLKSTKKPMVSVSSRRVSDSQSASSQSRTLIIDDLAKSTAKSVSSSSNDKSQATNPVDNTTRQEKTEEPSDQISVAPVKKPQLIDFAARLKSAAAARLESMNDVRVLPQASSTQVFLEPVSPKSSNAILARIPDNGVDEPSLDGDRKQPAHEPPKRSDKPVDGASQCLDDDDDEETGREHDGLFMSEIDARSQAVEINYIGDRTRRFHDSQSLATEPPLVIAPTSNSGDASQTVMTMETPLRGPPGGTFDTYDRSTWSSVSGSHVKKAVQPPNNFYYFDERDEDCNDEEVEEYEFDERVAKLSSLLPASTRKKKRIAVVAPFNVASFFLNLFTALWILIGVWTKHILGFKRTKKSKSHEVTKAEPNFRGFQVSGDIQPTTSTKIQGGGHRTTRSRHYKEEDAGTVVHYVVPDVHGSGEVDQHPQVWKISSSSQSTHGGSWQTPKIAATYSSIRQSFSRSDARSVASMKDWSATPSLRYTGFVEE
jgi:hypothetical protein